MRISDWSSDVCSSDLADALNARFEGVGTGEMLRKLFAEGTLGKIATVSSFGTESAVLLHLVAQADPAVPVIFVDTLKLFPETLEYRETRSEEHTSELQSLMRNSYAVICLIKKQLTHYNTISLHTPY